MLSMPSNAHPLALFPTGNARAKFVNNACDLVSGDAGELYTRPPAFFRKRVTMTNSAGLHANSEVASWRRRNLTFKKLKFGSGRTNWTAFILGMGTSLVL
jgi:hypothetical protein